MNKREITAIRKITEDSSLLEIARKAVEDVLVDWRDARISQFARGNGLVIRERNGKDSSIIRMGIEDAIRIGLLAICKSSGN